MSTFSILLGHTIFVQFQLTSCYEKFIKTRWKKLMESCIKTVYGELLCTSDKKVVINDKNQSSLTNKTIYKTIFNRLSYTE